MILKSCSKQIITYKSQNQWSSFIVQFSQSLAQDAYLKWNIDKQAIKK